MAHIAIVSTIINVQHVLHSFVTYHRAIGVSHFWFFVDDPDQLPTYQALNLTDCTFIPKDAALRQSWTTLGSWPTHMATVDTDQMSRQALNTDLAIGLATALGVDWLLHIDADELFYLPAGNAADYFSARSQYGSVKFPNHEAIPEAVHIDDYFLQVTLFKRNPSTMPWYDRPAALPFNFYGNGKSAVNLNAGHVRSHGPHLFLTDGPTFEETDWVSILHYPVCGLSWYRQKYQVLGSGLSDFYYSNESLGTRFAADLRGRDSLTDAAAAERQYIEDIMAKPTLNTAALISRGVLFRVDLSAELAGRQRASMPWAEPPVIPQRVPWWVSAGALLFAGMTGLGVAYLVTRQK